MPRPHVRIWMLMVAVAVAAIPSAFITASRNAAQRATRYRARADYFFQKAKSQRVAFAAFVEPTADPGASKLGIQNS